MGPIKSFGSTYFTANGNPCPAVYNESNVTERNHDTSTIQKTDLLAVCCLMAESARETLVSLSTVVSSPHEHTSHKCQTLQPIF